MLLNLIIACALIWIFQGRNCAKFIVIDLLESCRSHVAEGQLFVNTITSSILKYLRPFKFWTVISIDKSIDLILLFCKDILHSYLFTKESYSVFYIFINLLICYWSCLLICLLLLSVFGFINIVIELLDFYLTATNHFELENTTRIIKLSLLIEQIFYRTFAGCPLGRPSQVTSLPLCTCQRFWIVGADRGRTSIFFYSFRAVLFCHPDLCRVGV